VLLNFRGGGAFSFVRQCLDDRLCVGHGDVGRNGWLACPVGQQIVLSLRQVSIYSFPDTGNSQLVFAGTVL
jgi:hypothetical protein